MSGPDKQSYADLIQAYARSRWSDKPDKAAADRLAAQLESDLRDRIDMLGADAEHLLAVNQEDVIRELESLEKAAELEDAGVKRAATRARAREETKFNDAAKDTRRNRRVPQGKYRPSAQHGRRGKRGQR